MMMNQEHWLTLGPATPADLDVFPHAGIIPRLNDVVDAQDAWEEATGESIDAHDDDCIDVDVPPLRSGKPDRRRWTGYDTTNADEKLRELAEQRRNAIHIHDGNLNDRSKFVGRKEDCPFCNIDPKGC